MGTTGSNARANLSAADEDGPFHYRSASGELVFLDLKRRRLSRPDHDDEGGGRRRSRTVDVDGVMRRRHSSSSSYSETSSSGSSGERATPRRVMPFDGADKPDFGYLERVLTEYERLAKRRRSLRGVSVHGSGSSSNGASPSGWCGSPFSFDDPGPLQRFDLRRCPALADVVARVEREGGGGDDHLLAGGGSAASAAGIMSGSSDTAGMGAPGSSLLRGGRSLLVTPIAALMQWMGRGGAGGGGSKALTFWTLIRRFCYKYHGIPDDLRARAWGLIGEALGVNYDERFFRLLCKGAWVEECYRDQIDRDVARTSFGGEAMGEEARQGMRRVLLAYATYNTRVGYVSGMHWLVGMLFRCGLDEQGAFRLFFTLMEAYGMADLYAHDYHGLKECFSLLDSLLASHLKRLHKHLHKENIPLEALAQSWLLTLFSSSAMEPSLVARFWDVVLLAGCLQREHLRRAAQTCIVHFVFRLLQQSERLLLQQPDMEAMARLVGATPTPPTSCDVATSLVPEERPTTPIAPPIPLVPADRPALAHRHSSSSLPQPPAFGPTSFFPTTPAELFPLLRPDRVSQQIAHSLQAGLLRPRHRARSHKTCVRPPPSTFSTTLGNGGEAATSVCTGDQFTPIAAAHAPAVVQSHPTTTSLGGRGASKSAITGDQRRPSIFSAGSGLNESRRSNESSPQPSVSGRFLANPSQLPPQQQPQQQQQDARGAAGSSSSHNNMPRWLPVLGRRTTSSTLNEEDDVHG